MTAKRERRLTFRKGQRQDLNLCYRVSPSGTKAKLNLPLLPLPRWLTSPLKVTQRLMSWSLTEEMCLTLRPSCLPPPVMIIILSNLHSCWLSQQVILNHSGGHTCLSPPIFLLTLLCLIPVVRWRPHYLKCGCHRDSGIQQICLWGQKILCPQEWLSVWQISTE